MHSKPELSYILTSALPKAPYLARKSGMVHSLRKRIGMILLGGILLTALPIMGQHPGLGRISFKASGYDAAKQWFLKGMLLYYSCEYADARKCFFYAQQLDPNFYMAYWGEALSHFHPLWYELDRQAALMALRPAGPDPEERLRMAPSQREREWMQALEILLSSGPGHERVAAFAEALRQMHVKYPTDDEAAALYALTLLSTTRGVRNPQLYMQVAAIAEEVYERNPDHPGALLVLLHVYDDPLHAPLGQRAALRYAEVAPEVAYAQHMPSHVFAAMGDWKRTVAANLRAWEAGEARRERADLPHSHKAYTARWWQHYGMLQQGRFAETRQFLVEMEKDYRDSALFTIAWHLVRMRAAWLVESEQWYNSAYDIEVKASELDPESAALQAYVTGYVAWRRNDALVLQAMMARLQNILANLPTRIGADAQPLHPLAPGMSPPKGPGPETRTAVDIMYKSLTALLTWQKGDRAYALNLMAAAATAEAAMPFLYGPPIIAKPTHELLAEMFLARGEAETAVEAYMAALERNPGRTLALKGMEKAAREAGDPQLAEKTRERWVAILKSAREKSSP